MGWVLSFAGAVCAGLAVLAFCTLRVWRAVRALGRELERAQERLAPEQGALRDELQALEEARDSQNA